MPVMPHPPMGLQLTPRSGVYAMPNALVSQTEPLASLGFYPSESINETSPVKPGDDSCVGATFAHRPVIQVSAEKRIEQQLDVQGNDDGGHDPGGGGDGAGDGELPHLSPIGDEPHQRNDSEGKLHRQHDLTEDKQLSGATLAIQRGDDNDRDNGDAARDKSSCPAWQTQVKEAFHDDLA